MITASSGRIFDYSLNGAMPIYGERGDSGSPLFAWDTVQKWVLVGVLTAGNGAGGAGNNWAVMPLDYIKNTISADSDPSVVLDSYPEAALTGVSIPLPAMVRCLMRTKRLPCTARKAMT